MCAVEHWKAACTLSIGAVFGGGRRCGECRAASAIGEAAILATLIATVWADN